jgi:hypothetical protein
VKWLKGSDPAGFRLRLSDVAKRWESKSPLAFTQGERKIHSTLAKPGGIGKAGAVIKYLQFKYSLAEN